MPKVIDQSEPPLQQILEKSRQDQESNSLSKEIKPIRIDDSRLKIQLNKSDPKPAIILKSRNSHGSQSSLTAHKSMLPNIKRRDSSSCVDGLQSDASMVADPRVNCSHEIADVHTGGQNSSKSMLYNKNQQVQGEQRSKKLGSSSNVQ